MKSFNQYFTEQGPYHNPDNGRFRQNRHTQDTNALLHQAEMKIKAMGDRTPEEIRTDVAELLMKINHMYSAVEQEATPAKGRLADKRTQVVQRGKELGGVPSYAEARKFLLDVKRIIEG